MNPSERHLQELASHPLYQAEEPRRKYHLALFMLSFALSTNGYEKISKRLRPFFSKLGIKIPEREEFAYVITRSQHDHRTPLKALYCLNDECLPDDTRRGLKVFLEVHIFVLFFEFLWSLPGHMKRGDSLTKIFSNISTSSSRQIGLVAASYVFLYKVYLRFFKRVFDPLSRPPYARLYTDRIYDKLLRSMRLPPAYEFYEKLFHSPSVPPALAGFCAGPAILFAKDQSQRVTMSVYILLKSFQFLYHSLYENRIIPRTPWWLGSWILFPLSSAQLIHAYLVNPDTFSESYERFITSRSTTYVQPRPGYYPKSLPWPTGREIVDSIGVIASLNYPEFYSKKLHRDVPPLPKELNPIQPILEIAHPAHTKTMCAMLHPDEPSCLVTFSKFVAKEGVGALKFMAIINGIGIILRWKQIRERPYESVMHWLNHSVPLSFKGATFITMAIATSWGLICGLQNIFPAKFMPVSRIYLNGFIGGLWIFAEDSNRRLDIGMYSLRLSLESIWKLLVKKKKVKAIKYSIERRSPNLLIRNGNNHVNIPHKSAMYFFPIHSILYKKIGRN
ncbi:778_t:CDS:2 [Ambispora leptoticha]|uniref:778_t:CDS:1 n=1 Tax=Ambispora leptoticha TaxID=144679 RepID=A0A9N8VKG2_9GLOM|nr:778_t:CDS:2 [Ambispora leptoticha]